MTEIQRCVFLHYRKLYRKFKNKDTAEKLALSHSRNYLNNYRIYISIVEKTLKSRRNGIFE
jgi:hypothetical protein